MYIYVYMYIDTLGRLRYESTKNYRSLLQKSPIKETLFCK